jgi:CHASE2 domain-containing sensor protein
MTFVLAQSLVTFFAVIALVHVYWGLGGQWAAVAAVPQLPGEGGARSRPAFKPSGWATLLVAFGMLLIAALVCLRVGWWVPAVPHQALQWVLSAIAMLMFARAIGDSDLVGFFKQIKGSRFARLDTWVYSPLCVVLGAGLLAVAWI